MALDDEVVDTTLVEDVFVDEVAELVEEELLVEPFELVVDEATLLLLEDLNDESKYISSLFPAPQYSYAFPGHVKEQSESVARVDDAARVSPQ